MDMREGEMTSLPKEVSFRYKCIADVDPAMLIKNAKS